MAGLAFLPPFVLLLLGLYYCAAGIGGLTAPEAWRQMVREMARSPFEQFIGGFLALFAGGVLLGIGLCYDGTAPLLLRLLGALALLKGVLMLALPGRFLPFTDTLLAHRARAFAFFAIAFGLFLLVIGASRLPLILI